MKGKRGDLLKLRKPDAVISYMAIPFIRVIVPFLFEGVMNKFKQACYSFKNTQLGFHSTSNSPCKSKTAHCCLTMSLRALKPRNPMWTWVPCIIGFWVVYYLICMSQKYSCETFSWNRQTLQLCMNIYIFNSLKIYSTFGYYLRWKYRTYFL